MNESLESMEDDVGREGARWGIEIARSAHEMGIPIATGTDNAAAGAQALFEELELLVDAVGLTPTEGLSAATHAGARALGRQDVLGSAARPTIDVDATSPKNARRLTA